MARERAETREKWATLVARWKRSGASAGEFCRREGVRAEQLAWWAGRLRTLGGEASPVPFVELVGTAVDPVRSIEVVLRGGVVMRVPVGFDEATVVRLARLLDGANP